MTISTDILLIIIILQALGLIALAFFVFRLSKHYNSFLKNTKKSDLVSVLNEVLKQLNSAHKNITDLESRFQQKLKADQINFNRLGFKRFNPFASTGGDQSFCLCLLDETNTGFVISSLHSRENTRIYAKKIINGKSPEQTLSDEEKEVLQQAIKS